MFGKLVDGELEIAGAVLHTATEQIFNAKPEIWIANGWKPVYYDSVEDIEKEYTEVLEETEDSILIHWQVI